ncbi:MAG: insulinase family protein [Alphaproteobacteria bacterium]|nr:insulinase family protein [Alphaproteobacteria bacterium]
MTRLLLPLLALLALFSEARPQDADPVEVIEDPGPDRATPPAVRPPVRLDLPDPTPLSDGRVQHVRVEGVRRVEVSLRLPVGRVDLCPDDRTPCDALESLWALGSEAHPPEAMEPALDRLDAWIAADVHSRATYLSLSVPRESLAEGVGLLDEVLRQPVFSKVELRRAAADARYDLLEADPTDLDAVSYGALDHGWFPPESPFGARPDPDAWRRLAPGDVAALHQALLAQGSMEALVVGDLSEAEAAAVAPLLEGFTAAGPPAAPPLEPLPEGLRVIGVDLPSGGQTAIRLRTAAPVAGDPERVDFALADFALCGAFKSRINTVLREEKGWTYGASSWHGAHPAYGTWTLAVDVPQANVLGAIDEIERLLSEYVEEGSTPEEVDAAWRDELTWWNRMQLTAGHAAGFYGDVLGLGESVADAAARADARARGSAESTRSAAAPWLAPDAPRLWVIVGDQAVLAPMLESRGWPVEWISPEDAVLGAL